MFRNPTQFQFSLGTSATLRRRVCRDYVSTFPPLRLIVIAEQVVKLYSAMQCFSVRVVSYMRAGFCQRPRARGTVVSVCTNNGCANGVDETGMPVNVDACTPGAAASQALYCRDE